jgi:hypothetical protein
MSYDKNTYNKLWRERNADHIRRYWQEYRDNNKVKIAERDRNRKQTPQSREKRRFYCWKKAYGIDRLQFVELFAAQGKVCAMSKTVDPKCRKGWHIDHDHVTGKVRGVLCPRCNSVLAQSRDNIAVLKSAIAYLNHAGKPMNIAVQRVARCPETRTLPLHR